MHGPAPEQMKVYMKYGLSGLPVTVHDGPEALFGNPFFFRDRVRGPEHAPDQFIVLFFYIERCRYMFFGHNEYMHRCLRG